MEKCVFRALVWISLGFFMGGCATVGPAVSSSEIDQKKAELEIKAARYKETQRERVRVIANRLIQFMPEDTREQLKGIRIDVSDEGDINAHASFNELIVNYGMLRFTESDDQLATVIAHELAHIVKGHVHKSLATNVMAGAVGMAAGAAVDGLGGGGAGTIVSQGITKGIAGAFSRDFEREADFYGFQYLYIAGFDVMKGAEIWERFAIEAPKSMTRSLFSTHPSSPERLVRAEKVLEELHLNGVVPNLFKTSNLPGKSIIPLGSMSFSSVNSSGSVMRQNTAKDKASLSAEQQGAQDELQQLKRDIEKLKQEQTVLLQDIAQQVKIKSDQEQLELALEEALEASKQLRYEEFGVKDIGIAKKVTNLWIAKKVDGEQRVFSVKQGGLDWFVQYRQASANTLKALGLMKRSYRIYWYSPNGRVYSEQEFRQSDIRADFAKSSLSWDPELGDYLIGEWKVRVFEGGKFIDERTFEVLP